MSAEITYKIVAVTGDILQKGGLNSTEKQIDVSSLDDGVYILQLLEKNKQVGQQKIINQTIIFSKPTC